MHTDDSMLSDGISFFESMEESTGFGKLVGIDGKEPGHVVYVVGEGKGLEATVEGIVPSNLSKFFDNKHCLVIRRTPNGVDMTAIQQGFKYGVSLLGNPYDYSGIFGKLVDILTPLEGIFPFIRRWPVPLHWPGARFCSAYVADIYKHTDRYAGEPIFKKWNITRISPSVLWEEFQWEPINYDVGILRNICTKFTLRRPT